MNKPSFFVVGLPKTGTTTLYHVLKQHPDIFIPGKKELNHFNKDMANEILEHKKDIPLNYTIDKNKYLEYYTKAKYGHIKVDISPQYSLSKVAAKEIYQFNPNAKILIIFREPVSYLYSAHSENLFGLYEDEKDFKTAINLSKDRKKGKFIPKGALRPGLLFYEDFIKYKEILKQFTDVFPNNQVLVMLYDELLADYNKALSKILLFMGLDGNYDFNIEKHNTRKTYRSKFLRKMGKSKKLWLLLNKSLPKPLFNFSKKIYYKILIKKASKEPLDQKTQETLKNRYKPGVIEFEKFVHDNNIISNEVSLVKLWGY